MRISGLVKFGSVGIGGATLAGFDLPTAQSLFDKKGALDEIGIAAKPNVTDPKLLSEVRAVLPANAQVRTGAQQAAEDAKDTDTFISFLRGFLLAFGGIALFVGSFVIANSLSITIAQRTREFATSARWVRPSPGPAGDRRRGARDRLRRRWSGCSSASESRRALQAVQRGRVHAAEQRHHLRHPHGIVSCSSA